MTIEEAKDYILKNWFDGDDSTDSVHDADEEITAMKTAIEALGKQEAKKPKFYDAHPAPIYMCPACDSTFITRCNTKSKMSYCNNCGQAISWEEVDG